MNLKRRISMLLASVMMVGTVGTLGAVPANAAGETNTFTLTVPADTNITKSGWNEIGSVGVTNVLIESGSKIKVEIEGGATGRKLKKQGDESKTVDYEIKKGSTSAGDAFGEKLEFTADGTQAIGAVVSDFSEAANGTYEDTINFKATFVSAENFPLTGTDAVGKVLKASELLKAEKKNFEYGGKTYTAYNGYISKTAGANFADAQGFVAVLNNVELDGRTGGWTLLTNADMAYNWWLSTDSAVNMGASSVGGLEFVWSGVESGDRGYCWNCSIARGEAEGGHGANIIKSEGDAWYSLEKPDSDSAAIGFVVLRVSS